MQYRVGSIFEKAPGVPRSMAVLLFDGHTMQDWVGPLGPLSFFSRDDLKIQLVAAKAGPVREDSGRFSVNAECSFDDVSQVDVLLVPGGDPRAALQNGALLAWLRRLHATTEITASVCTGSLLLGAAGLLGGKRVSTAYWARESLQRCGAVYEAGVVEDGKIITTAGASGGIELGLRLAEMLAGREFAEAMQLAMEYEPEVYGTGDVRRASTEVHQRVLQLFESDGRFAIPAAAGV